MGALGKDLEKSAPLTAHSLERERLPYCTRIFYGLGHALNDVTAVLWFSYMLIYLIRVVGMDESLAGIFMMVGQILEAVVTPLVGYETDRTKGFWNYGHRKSWHLLGTLFAGVAFPFLFIQCLVCNEHTDDYAWFIYYIPFLLVFQIGWVSVQLSHLAIVLKMTSNAETKVELNAIRFGGKMLTSIATYGVTWALLGSEDAGTDHLSKNDAPVFRDVVLLTCSLSGVLHILFHIFVKEPDAPPPDGEMGRKASLSSTEDATESSALVTPQPDPISSSQPPALPLSKLGGGVGGGFQKLHTSYDSSLARSDSSEMEMTWREWWREPQFYQVAVLNLGSRVTVNLLTTYLAVFLTVSLQMEKTAIASVPLVVYTCGFVGTLLVKPLTSLMGKKWLYFLSAVGILACAFWMWMVPAGYANCIFICAVLLGISRSILMVTALSMTADLIGENVSSAAFVYSTSGFLEKIVSGISISIIQYGNPCGNDLTTECSQVYYRAVVTLIPASCMFLSLLALVTLCRTTIGKLNRTESKKRLLLMNLLHEDSDDFDIGNKYGTFPNSIPRQEQSMSSLLNILDRSIVARTEGETRQV